MMQHMVRAAMDVIGRVGFAFEMRGLDFLEHELGEEEFDAAEGTVHLHEFSLHFIFQYESSSHAALVATCAENVARVTQPLRRWQLWRRSVREGFKKITQHQVSMRGACWGGKHIKCILPY